MLLADVLEWRRRPDRWERPAAAVAAVAAALAADDDQALDAANARLERAADPRVERIDPDAVPPPEPLRERTVLLVHDTAPEDERSSRPPAADS